MQSLVKHNQKLDSLFSRKRSFNKLYKDRNKDDNDNDNENGNKDN